jgi:PAS domain S-box-containing protein
LETQSLNRFDLEEKIRSLEQERDAALARVEELERDRQTLSALIDYIPVGITIADAPDVTIRRVSRYGQEVTGRPRDHIEGISAGEISERLEIYHPDGRPASSEELPLARATRKGEIVRGEEWTLRRPDGAEIVALCNAGPIRDQQGQITGGVTAWKDITARVEAEKRVAQANRDLARRVCEATEAERRRTESEERFRALIDSIPHMVWSARADGFIDYYSRRILDYAGVTPEQAQDWDWVEALHPEDRQPTLDAMEKSVRAGAEYLVEYRIRNAQTGEYRWFQGHAVAQRDAEGRILRWYGTSTDIQDRKDSQQLLLESEERLVRFIGAMDEIAFEFDSEGRYLHVWSGDENLLKMPPGEFLGKRVEEVLPQELAERLFSSFRRIRETGEPENLEYFLEVRGGARWFLARIALVPSQGGAEPTFSFLARDITRLKEMEQSLQESQRRFRGLFDNAATGMALVAMDGRCLEANPFLCKMLGYSLEELRQTPFAAYSHPQDCPADIEEFERLGRGEINAYSLEKRFVRKDGQIVWGCLTVSLQRDEEDTPLYALAVVENITKRKEVEAQKSRLLDELEAIFASAAEGIILHDEDGTILRINPAAMGITGLSEAHRGADPCELYLSAPSRGPDGTIIPLQETPLYKALHGSAQRSQIVQFQRRDGQPVWISFSATPIFTTSGHQVGTVATFADITRLRELQEQMENYLHMMAHDLRSPLTVIFGHAQILQLLVQETDRAEESLLSTRSILSASDQMQQMMEDLVDFGHLESGQITLADDLIDLRVFLGEFLHRQKVSDEYRRVRVQIPAELPPVRMGIYHLERVLANVIGNALKYTGADRSVDVEVLSTGGQVSLVVQDYGEGIAPEDLPHIFDRYYRAPSGKQKAGGTGLGLYISRSLLEAYGGHIRAKNETGKGARFTICLPGAAPAEIRSPPEGLRSKSA